MSWLVSAATPAALAGTGAPGDLEPNAAAATMAVFDFVGVDAEFVDRPQPVLPGYGSRTYRFRLATPPDDRWAGDLILRLGPRRGDGAALAREAWWHQQLRGAGHPVAEVLAVSGEGLVFGAGPSRSLTEVIGANPAGFAVQLRLLGDWHARTHALVIANPPPHPAPLAEGVGEAPEPALGREWEWLERHRPDVEARVVAHGDFQPAHVRLEADDPGSVLITNWSGAWLAPREWDVARTILTLWSAPYLAPGRMERMVLRMARDSVVDAYLEGYRARAAVDDAALAYWGAGQALDWAARMQPPVAPADVWDPVGLVRDPTAYRADLLERFWELAEGQG